MQKLRCFEVVLKLNALFAHFCIGMDVTAEEEHYFKFSKIIQITLPKHLRALFIVRWNAKFPEAKWSNDASSGIHLLHEISGSGARKSVHIVNRELLLKGDCELWDLSTLLYVLLHTDLKLTDTCRPSSQRFHPLSDGEKIDRIREIRSEFFSHNCSASISTIQLNRISAEIKGIANDLFGSCVEIEIDQLIKSKMITPAHYELQRMYTEEKQFNNELMMKLRGKGT